MKVLITGGYGFIGSHVADCFYKEGYDVYIIDNLATGRKDHISFRHNGYEMSVEDPGCEEIFRSNHFDVAVHLAGQANDDASRINPIEDAQSNIIGLLNMLNFAHKYQVRKFLYASSAAVYSTIGAIGNPLRESDPCKPQSPYGISKLAGESYCLNWNGNHVLDTVCFRISSVYGPRQGKNGEGGFAAEMIEQFIQKREIAISLRSDRQLDLVYVEDVAQAIFRAAQSKLSGIYNLSANTPLTVKEFSETIRAWDESCEINFIESIDQVKPSAILSSQKLKQDLDWSPKHGISEGLRKTYTWLKSEKQMEGIPEKREKPSILLGRKWLSKYRPYAENLAMFALAAWFTVSNPIGVYQSFDIGLFYILAIGVAYGNKQSMPAAGLTVGLLLYQKLDQGREMLSLLYDTSFFFLMAIYLLTGMIAGYSFTRKESLISGLKDKLQKQKEKMDLQHRFYLEMREAKEKLESRIISSEDSVGKIHSIVKELDGLEPEKIFSSTVNVVQSIMKAGSASIYMFAKNPCYLRLIASTNPSAFKEKNSLHVEDYPFIQGIINGRKVFANKSLDQRLPSMAAPIFHNGKAAAILLIDGLEYENFSLYHENLFKITSEMVASAVSRTFSFIDATRESRFMPGSMILKEEVFEEILLSKINAYKKHRMPYALLQAKLNDGESLPETSIYMSGLLRENDYLGQLDDQTIKVLLSNTDDVSKRHVISRLAEHGVALAEFEGV